MIAPVFKCTRAAQDTEALLGGDKLISPSWQSYNDERTVATPGGRIE